MHVFKPYFSHSIARFFALVALVALLALPFFTFAQAGYGGGGGGGTSIWGPGGYIPPFTPASTASTQSQGLVLGATAFNFMQTLRLGMSGEDVIELQKILITGGFLDLDAPSGYFGPMTEEAVKKYQKANGLEGVGIVGPLTRVLLNARVAVPSLESPSMLSNTGSQNPLLPQLQRELLNLLIQLRSLLGSR